VRYKRGYNMSNIISNNRTKESMVDGYLAVLEYRERGELSEMTFWD